MNLHINYTNFNINRMNLNINCMNLNINYMNLNINCINLNIKGMKWNIKVMNLNINYMNFNINGMNFNINRMHFTATERICTPLGCPYRIEQLDAMAHHCDAQRVERGLVQHAEHRQKHLLFVTKTGQLVIEINIIVCRKKMRFF